MHAGGTMLYNSGEDLIPILALLLLFKFIQKEKLTATSNTYANMLRIVKRTFSPEGKSVEILITCLVGICIANGKNTKKSSFCLN